MPSWSYRHPNTPLARSQPQSPSSHWDYSERPRNNYAPSIISKADTSHFDPIEIANAEREIKSMLLNHLGIGGS